MIHIREARRLCGFVIVSLFLGSCGSQETALPELPKRVPVERGVSVTGKVTFSGKEPALPPLQMNSVADPSCLHPASLKDERFVVSSQGGLAGVVVQIESSVWADDPEEIVIDQKGCLYTPSVSAGQAGAKITVSNSDPTFHNIRVIRHVVGEYSGGSNVSNDGQAPGALALDLKLSEPGIYRLECDVHRWMRAYVYLSEGIFVCVTDETGAFSFPRKLKDGLYVVKVWHPLSKKFLEKECRVTKGTGQVDFNFHSDDLIF